MSEVVSFEVIDAVGVVTVDSPPVNAVSQAVRAGILESVRKAEADSKVHAILIHCAGRTFFAGADIKEFDGVRRDPGFPEVLAALEGCNKPVIASLHGTALGGGLELALACHYRCAKRDARMGLPEVSLGIIPGAGGTQRLPRLIGAKATLEMILGIAPIAADKAHALGLIDELYDSDPKEGGLVYARQLIKQQAMPRRTSELPVDAKGFDEGFLADCRKENARRYRGQIAPERAIEAVSAAVGLPFTEGLAKEHEIGQALLKSDQSKALRHIFFAEREIARIPGLADDVKKIPINSVAILGAGTMGSGIAMVFADAGITVRLIEVADDALAKGLGTIRSNYERSVARGRMNAGDLDKRMGLIRGSTAYADLADADLVLEAVFEDFELKKKIFAEMDRLAKPGAILATNTSTLDIGALARETKQPSSVIGLHFFSPANVMRLLEIVRTPQTAPEVLATAVDLAKRIRKIGVVVGVCFGFVGNRMMIEGYHREADRLLLEGATPEQIDRAMVDFGFPMGPWTLHDMAGIDIMWKALTTTGRKAAHPEPYYNVVFALAEAGRFGQKTGAGFYKYLAGDRTPHPDPVTAEVIAREAARLGIDRDAVDDDEIRRRCVYSMINEGAKILAEGIAYRPGDIDVIWTNGYGFPRHLGGPMQYADTVGLLEIYKVVQIYSDLYGSDWEPAPLLEELAMSGKTFADFKPAT
jgi:3-hydroxyacyl-CoA dehydrogenase